jgi:hypothetical protein
MQASELIGKLKYISCTPERLTKLGHVMGAKQFFFPKFTLTSIGVGSSSDERVMEFCTRHGLNHDGKYNTWYFNSGDVDFDSHKARELFHYFPVKHNPIYYWSTKPFLKIRDQLPLMVQTAEKYGYLAFGCDGNKHRGPSVFAMFLCLAGIEPKVATKAANEFLGSNFVMSWVRTRIARLGYEYGNQNPELRERLKTLMGI